MVTKVVCIKGVKNAMFECVKATSLSRKCAFDS